MGKKQTIGDVVEEYHQSRDWLGLSQNSRRLYEYAIDIWRRDNRPISVISRKEVLAKMNAMPRPGMARNFVIVTSKLLSFALDRGYVEHNMAARIKKPGIQTPHKPWTEEAILEFRLMAKPEYVALMDICLYTGLRISDICDLQMSSFRYGDKMIVTIKKTGAEITFPWNIEIYKIVANRHRSGLFGKSASNKFNREARRLGIPFTFHGLRKNFAIRLAEAGATAEEIAAALGHSSIYMASYYVKEANKAKLVQSAMEKLNGKN